MAQAGIPESQAVGRFRKYLQICTVQPTPDYDGAMKFLEAEAKEIGLKFKTVVAHPGCPIAVLTWQGSEPSLPSILLNSHTDVVPVYPDKWKYDPFAAVKDENGDIYARGAQDMKCVGSQYLEAIRVLKGRSFQPKRTVHLSFVPDEEVGGLKGMMPFVKMDEFKQLNVGFALDEGLANPTDEFKVYYGERAPWWVNFKITGNPGHGSQFIQNTAAEKLVKIINWAMEFRQKEKSKLLADPSLTLGDVTTVNLTMMKGGVQPNVVPSDLSVVFDVRVTPREKLANFKAMVEGWARDAGEGVSIEYLQSCDIQHTTALNDTNPWWVTFSKTCADQNLKLKCEIFPAATDGRYLREVGIPTLGFSPMNNTPVLLHDHNEFLNEKIFIKGIEIYTRIISNLANQK